MNSSLSVRSKIRLFLKSSAVRCHSRKGTLPIEIRSSVGLGAKLEWCLEILAYCNEYRLIPQFKFSYPSSDKSEDYFSKFFSLKQAPTTPVRFITINSIVELDLGKDYDSALNIGLANYLIEKYLIVREDVISEVERFCCQHFANRRVLGVHYRGTDKVLESPVVPFDRVKRNIEYYLRRYPETDAIFIATDDMNFIESMEAASTGRAIISRNDSFRSRDGKSIHESAHTNKNEINRDAIVNCLILSRCDALLKTASILSGWSKLFNPLLPVVMLSVPYIEHLWFPERELVKNNLFEPIQ